ncbi:MAG TPA: polyprenyl synthetase family protein [Phycisphaerales bacterium]|nr:polyprenyl synthetase family protein [Phycisphaerales bacterium]
MERMLGLNRTEGGLKALVDRELQEVGLVFGRQLASDLSAVNRLCSHVERYRGKMLRPTLVIVSGLAAGGDPCDGRALNEHHHMLGAVAEMIHMATLVHDDVLDEAEVRRGGVTVNHLWGNESAVILGDYLISNAFHLCSTMMRPEINLALGNVTNTLCEGELVQLHHRHDMGIDEEAYLEIIRRKTASLIGECCRLGALLTGADARVQEAMKEYGVNVGVAFQIQDDLLDLVGDQRVVGKSLGRDLAKGKMTLPMILALADAGADGRGEILRLMSENNLDGLRAELQGSGHVNRAMQRAAEFVETAKGHLCQLPQSEARETLHAMADRVISREF